MTAGGGAGGGIVNTTMSFNVADTNNKGGCSGGTGVDILGCGGMSSED